MRFLPSQRWSLYSALVCLALFAASCSGGDSGTPLSNSEAPTPNTTVTGNSWRPMVSGTTELLWSVWGSSTEEVVAVGSRATSAHLMNAWEGKPTGIIADLCDVWTDPHGVGVAVGLDGTIIAYDGTSWSEANSGTTRGLFDAYGFGGDDIFVVGETGTILRFDGTTWSPMVSGTDVSLFGVWGNSPTNVFAVGVGGTIKNYDGTAWSFMTSPTTENLGAVWGTSESTVWAVGDAGTIIRYDSSGWKVVSSGTNTNLYDVWGSASDDVWAVGMSGSILRYNGSIWGPVASPTQSNLFGVWGRSVDEAYAVGEDGTIIRYAPDPNPTVAYLLHDHPDGAAAPPLYGLRLDDLLDHGRYTFSFDYRDDDEAARVILEHDTERNEIRISGRAFGGLDIGDRWSPDACGWIDIDFTYKVGVSVRDNCDQENGDDLHVTGASQNNTGTFSLDGWGGNAVFTFSDAANSSGCTFAFDNDEDPKGNDDIANDPETWSGDGWFHAETSGARDWLFTGELIGDSDKD